MVKICDHLLKRYTSAHFELSEAIIFKLEELP